jgi:hypothetical protein
VIVSTSPWPGAPRQWDLDQRDPRTGRTREPVAPLDEPLDLRVPALLLGLVLLVALLVVPLTGSAAHPDGSAAVVVAE